MARAIEAAVLARSGRREGEEIRFRCPHPRLHNNNDANPSARYHPEKFVWFCDACGEGGGWTGLCDLLGVSHTKPAEIMTTYPYTDEDGQLLFEVVRKVPKDFLQRRPNGNDGWIWDLKGVRRVLYRLPEVLRAVQEGRTIYLAEGEKDADNLAKLGLVATTNPCGAGVWRTEYTETLSGATVVLLRDNDTAGDGHVQKVTQALYGAVAEVRVVELPDLPLEGDVSNWIEAMKAGGAASDEIVTELERLVAEAGVWEPPTAEETVEGAGEAFRELWALGRDPDPADVRRVLARVAEELQGSNPLGVQTAREVAVRALKGKVSAPAKLVDAALHGVAEIQRPSSRPGPGRGANPPYRATEQGLAHLKATKDGEVAVPLTNFTAKIVGEVQRDDGVEIQRSFEIAAHHRGQEHRFEVTSREFSTMRWITEQLGATAILNAGRGTKDHARAAIQHLSDEVEVRRVYTHLGWRKIGAGWCYLHGGGAIGQVGQVSDIGIDLPRELARFALPRPPEPNDLRRAVEASLRCLDLLADEVTLPLFCAVFRAPLGASDFSVHVSGETGGGKTELAALAEQHYGSGLDARHLPGSWSSTANALEALAFAAKDALLVVDDFAPEGSRYDIQRLHGEASRLLRAQGNQSGRGRLRPDGTLRSVKAPRGLILSTGEDIPRNHSIRARTWVLEVAKGAMDWELLTLCQKDAASGLYAQTMAGFIRWLAPRYDEIQRSKPRRIADLRSQAVASSGHRRTPTIAAELAFALEQFIGFARESGVLSDEHAEALWSRGWAALGQAAANQAGHLDAQDQVSRFLDLLRSAIASGRAHLASADGNEPEAPEVWGWREKKRRGGEQRQGEWQPQGERIGWLQNDDLYLDPDAAYKAVEGMATLDGLSITSRTLWKRMSERGLLATVDSARETLRVRVTLEGARRAVLHLRSSTLLTQEPAQPAQSRRASPISGADSRAGSADEDQEPDQRTCPSGLVGVDLPSASGRAAPPPGEDGTEIEEWEEV